MLNKKFCDIYAAALIKFYKEKMCISHHHKETRNCVISSQLLVLHPTQAKRGNFYKLLHLIVCLITKNIPSEYVGCAKQTSFRLSTGIPF